MEQRRASISWTLTRNLSPDSAHAFENVRAPSVETVFRSSGLILLAVDVRESLSNRDARSLVGFLLMPRQIGRVWRAQI